MSSIYDFSDTKPSANFHPKCPVGFNGDVKVTKIEEKTSNQWGTSVFLEAEIMVGNMPNHHPNGSTVSFKFGMTGNAARPGKANLMSCIMRVWGYNPADPAHCAKMQGQEGAQIMAHVLAMPDTSQAIGKVVHVVAEPAVSQAGNPFAKYGWGAATGTCGPEAVPPPPKAPQPQAPTMGAPQPQFAPPGYAPAQAPQYPAPPQQGFTPQAPQQGFAPPQQGFAPPQAPAPQYAPPQAPAPQYAPPIVQGPPLPFPQQ